MKTLLAEMEAYGRTQGLPLLRAAELPLVQRLAAQQKPQRILEVGTALGYSAVHLIAQAPSHAELNTIEADAVCDTNTRSFRRCDGLARQFARAVGFSFFRRTERTIWPTITIVVAAITSRRADSGG